LAPQDKANNDIDVDAIEPLPPAASCVPVSNHDDIYEGIYIPQTDAEHVALVQRFRDEIHQDWLDDEMQQEGAVGSVNPLDHDLVEMAEAVRNQHQHDCRPYATGATSCVTIGTNEPTASIRSKFRAADSEEKCSSS
jgi:hypothetical protein